jgi:hypothetical protein
LLKNYLCLKATRFCPERYIFNPSILIEFAIDLGRLYPNCTFLILKYEALEKKKFEVLSSPLGFVIDNAGVPEWGFWAVHALSTPGP